LASNSFLTMAAVSKKRRVEEENRTFQEKWTQEYFVIEQDGKPLCLICKQKIAVVKEYNLKRHYETNHKTYDQFVGDQRKQKVESLRKGLIAQQSIFKKVTQNKEAAVHASYVVAHEIAKRGKPFSDGEYIKDCILKVADIVCPEKKATFHDVSLSRMTISRRVEEIGNDLRDQFRDNAGKFVSISLALDESTDIGDTSQLLIFLRGVSEDFKITEELLALVSLKDRTRGCDILDAVCGAMDESGLQWSSLVGITTDGAPSMTGANSGVVALLREKVIEKGGSEIIHYHCIIHQEALIAHVLKLDNVMDIVVKCVNFIKSSGLNHRQFKTFLEECEAEHGDVVYFAAVRWLSKGATLKRFFSLRKEIHEFMSQKGRDLPQLMDIEWLCDLAFLADIMGHFNELNLKLQGRGKFVSALFDHVKAFERKLKLLQKQLREGNLAHFPACKELADEESEEDQDRDIALTSLSSEKYASIMQSLQDEFCRRFVDFRSHEQDLAIFADPFSCDPEIAPTYMQMELIELQECTELKSSFRDLHLDQFYSELPAQTYPALRKHGHRMASLFGSTYICEKTFSIMNLNKSKLRTRLTDEHLHSVLRISTTNYEPRYPQMIAGKSQLHMSHSQN